MESISSAKQNQYNDYSCWQYILLAILLLVGIIYSLPVLYGEDPAVQISAVRDAPTGPAWRDKVESALHAAGMTAKSISQSDTKQLLLRFANPSTQFAAKEVVRAALADNYVVALNLAPRVPHWLSVLGAHPMKLGLDLRGGVHFLLKVDVQSLYQRRLEDNSKAIRTALRQDKIRYAGVLHRGKDQIILRFRHAEDRSRAQALLSHQFPDFSVAPSKNAQDPKSLQLVATIQPQALDKIRQEVVERTMTTLRKRVDELGVAEAIVQQQGVDRIAVDLPGIQDTARAKQVLGGTATLAFHLVDENHDPRVAAQGSVPLGSLLYYMRNGRPVLLQKQVILSGSAINNASAVMGDNGLPEVTIWASGPEVTVFSRATAKNIGHRMGIVYMETKVDSQLVDGKVVEVTKQIAHVISDATIQNALGNNFRITGIADAQEAQNLALLLRSGALEVPIHIIESRIVGPSLGAQNIKRGIVSLEVGLLLIILFMWMYYRSFGLIANMALMINLILLIALLSILGSTLTLPGIAGIVLTLGMAVDANVLIFERIREELRQGTSPKMSIQLGFERAFATIVDSNATTFIVAMILYAIGTGAVKGFAVTLMFGLLTSMLTAVVYSRAMVNLYYGSKPITRLSIGKVGIK